MLVCCRAALKANGRLLMKPVMTSVCGTSLTGPQLRPLGTRAVHPPLSHALQEHTPQSVVAMVSTVPIYDPKKVLDDLTSTHLTTLLQLMTEP